MDCVRSMSLCFQLHVQAWTSKTIWRIALLTIGNKTNSATLPFVSSGTENRDSQTHARNTTNCEFTFLRSSNGKGEFSLMLFVSPYLTTESIHSFDALCQILFGSWYLLSSVRVDRVTLWSALSLSTIHVLHSSKSRWKKKPNKNVECFVSAESPLEISFRQCPSPVEIRVESYRMEMIVFVNQRRHQYFTHAHTESQWNHVEFVPEFKRPNFYTIRDWTLNQNNAFNRYSVEDDRNGLAPNE